MDDELYFKVKEDSARKGMNLSEYFRDLLSKQSGVELVIDFADIYEYVEKIEQLTRKIDAILPTIYRSGKIYEKEAVFAFSLPYLGICVRYRFDRVRRYRC